MPHQCKALFSNAVAASRKNLKFFASNMSWSAVQAMSKLHPRRPCSINFLES